MARRKRPAIPWVPLVLLIVSVYIFWIMPLHMPRPEMKIDFEATSVKNESSR